jgi:hypothetical protein
MSGKIQVRLALLAALAALTAVLVPAGLAAGSHSGSDSSGGASYVLLTLKKGSGDQVAWVDGTGSTLATDPISLANNNCLTVGYARTILEIDPIGGQLGHVKEGFGVKSASDGAGEPCGRIEADKGEGLSISLGSSLDGNLMTAVDLDLELKFNAKIDVTFWHEGTQVGETATVEGTGDSDDGPDSSDNVRFPWRPGVSDGGGGQEYFDTVVFTPVTGSFSLEGGTDAPANGALLSGNKSSQIEVVASFDGEITCGDSRNIGIDGSPDAASGIVTMHSMDLDRETAADGEWIADDNCLLKPYNADFAADSISFVPVLAGTQARYTLEVTVPNQPITTSDGTDGLIEGTITSLVAEYDPNGGLSFPAISTFPLQACQVQPVLPGEVGYSAFWTQDSPLQAVDSGTGLPVDVLPPGENICFYSATASPTGIGVATEYWGILFIDDPGVKFR